MSYERAGLVVIAAVAACDPQPRASDDVASGTEVASETWNTRRVNGMVVRVRPEALPVREGPTTFLIELDPPPAEAINMSVDLVSPSMPAHGIARYEAHAERRERYRAAAEIPMAGYWTLYVNFDDGGTAVPFSFEAFGADGGTPAAHDPHGHTRSSAAGDGTHPCGSSC